MDEEFTSLRFTFVYLRKGNFRFQQRWRPPRLLCHFGLFNLQIKPYFFYYLFSLPKCWTNNSQRVLFNFENYYVVVRYFWSTTTRRLPVYLILETKNRLYEKHCKSLIYRVLQKLSFIFPNTFLMEKWLFDKFLEMLICYRTQKCPLTQTDFMTNIL